DLCSIRTGKETEEADPYLIELVNNIRMGGPENQLTSQSEGRCVLVDVVAFFICHNLVVERGALYAHSNGKRHVRHRIASITIYRLAIKNHRLVICVGKFVGRRCAIVWRGNKT